MRDETFETIKYILENEHELFLNKEECEIIFGIGMREIKNSEHIGIRPERCNDNEREAAFQKVWFKENEIKGSSSGILQDLFKTYSTTGIPTKIELEINKREKMIVATVIQWLGSNVGFSFLGEALKECGYSVIKNENKSSQ